MLTSPLRATVAFDGHVLHGPRLCSPLSAITLAGAVTNTSVWWNLYPLNTTFGRSLYPWSRSTFLTKGPELTKSEEALRQFSDQHMAAPDEEEQDMT
jgi:hypothetical protein